MKGFTIAILAVVGILGVLQYWQKTNASRYVKNLSTVDFNSAINGSVQPVLVDFWAPWCPPCRHLAPTIDKLGERTGSRAVIAKVNIDDHPRLAERYNIRSIPTIIIFRNGEPSEVLQGVVSLDELEHALWSNTAQ